MARTETSNIRTYSVISFLYTCERFVCVCACSVRLRSAAAAISNLINASACCRSKPIEALQSALRRLSATHHRLTASSMRTDHHKHVWILFRRVPVRLCDEWITFTRRPHIFCRQRRRQRRCSSTRAKCRTEMLLAKCNRTENGRAQLDRTKRQ